LLRRVGRGIGRITPGPELLEEERKKNEKRIQEGGLVCT